MKRSSSIVVIADNINSIKMIIGAYNVRALNGCKAMGRDRRLEREI